MMLIDNFRLPQQWLPQGEEASVATFSNSVGDLLSINHFATAPDIEANIENPESLRTFYRNAAEAHKVALIEADSVVLDGLRAVRTILKTRLDPRGFAFIGSFTLPFSNCSFVVKVQSIERGITGIRESAVLVMEGSRFVLDETTGKMIGWEQDPYDQTHKGEFMRNCADDPRFDDAFPDHPLSKVRRYLAELADGIAVTQDIKELAPFIYKSPHKKAWWRLWN